MSKLDQAQTLDHSSHTEFYDYYAKQSLTAAARERFRAIRDTVLRVSSPAGDHVFDVADIGCGAGTKSLVGRTGISCARPGHQSAVARTW